MEQINRKAIAVERYFAQRSDSFSDLDEINEADISERLSQLSVITRLAMASAAIDGLNELCAKTADLSSIMPGDISAMRSLSIRSFSKQEELKKFLLWLRGLQLANERGRVEWLASLRNVASRFDGELGSFIQTFFSLSNQRVFFRNADKKTLIMTVAEREWGCVTLRFEGCESEAAPDMPLPGYLVAAEAKLTEEGSYNFQFLVDTYFGEDEFVDRLLSDDGWQTVCFCCNNVTSEIACVDYFRHMDECGTPKADAVEDCCRILLNKRLLLGEGGLNSAERTVMPIAAFIAGLNSMNQNELSRWQCEELILESLNNRYAVENFGRLVRECGCTALAKCIDAAAQASYDNNDEEALKCAKLFSSVLEKDISDGTARPLLHSLCSQFEQASKLNRCDTARTIAETEALSRVRSSVLPLMDSLGFEGRFPNFLRHRKGKLEYISFILDRKTDRLKKGVMSFTASVAAAETDAQRLDECRMNGFSSSDTTALDCLAEAFGPSHYAELCCSEDNMAANIDVELYRGSGVVNDDSVVLGEFVSYAERQFETGTLPFEYRRRRKSFPGKGSAFLRALVRFLPVYLVVMISALVCYMLFAGGTVDRGAALLMSAAAGFLADIIVSVVFCVFSSRRLWRY